MMKRDLRFSRRRLLKSLGAGAALLPMLQADRTDAACYVGGIKRMYILCWTNGMLSSINNWATAGNDPSSWSLGSMGFQDSLKPYMADLLLLKGVDYKFIKDMPGGGERTGHACFPGMLTGAFYKTVASNTGADLGGGISVDQYVGKQLQQAKGYKGLVSLNQQAFQQSTGRLSWSAPGQVVPPEPDPKQVFNLYFKGMLPAPPPPTTGAGGKSGAGGAPPVDNTAKIQASILDYVKNDLTRFSNIVGSDDKQNIDQHLTAVRNIEMRLQATGGGTPTATDGGAPISVGVAGTCAVPDTSTEPAVGQSTPPAAVPAITKLHMDLAIAAFGADLTRVVVMQIGDQGDANLDMPWLGFTSNGVLNAGDKNTGLANGFHSIAHENTMRKVTCDTWFQSQAAYMIGQLKSLTDGTGKSMLDSSVFVAMNAMRTGTHETTGVPVVMAGSCGGYFKTGRSLALPAGTPNNGLLVALCNAMGTPVSTFGEASYGGELTALKGV